MSRPYDFWERVKLRYPRLADWDVVRDQSHGHHSLNVGLIFGTFGCLASLPVSTTWAQGWACGVLGGTFGYMIRERWFWLWIGEGFSTVGRWDGTLDVTVPMARLLPLALCALLWAGMPVWLVPLAQVLLVGEALGYSFLRPAGSLFYGGHGLREDVCG